MDFRMGARIIAAAVCLGVFAGAGAQTLSSPMGAGAAPPVSGQGQGYHSPLSAIPPLVPRADVVPWSVLAEVKEKFQKPKIITLYSPAIRKLDTTTVKIQGYMTPLEPGTEHRHFLLLSVPPSCPFCVPGGPESIIEVRTNATVKYTQTAIVVEGRFHVLDQDPQGLYYRMTDARVVK